MPKGHTRLITRTRGNQLERQTYRLAVIDGGQLVHARTFSSDVLTLGSASEVSFCIADESVSRRHARLEVGDWGIRLVDLGSTNGTYLSGYRIERALLPDNATIQLGASHVHFEVLSESAALPISDRTQFGRLWGQSTAMRRVFSALESGAKTDSTVLITGESGTGKELAAESIHQASARRAAPLVVLDCSALPASLFEDELFGHERGAFTGATHAVAGIFEQADGGTIFLDEIGEIDTALQSRLLRFLENKTVKRIGGSTHRKVDVRVIAATHRDLERMVASGDFREDLYYRLSVLQIRLPPLREREGDAELLARRLLADLAERYPRAAEFELTPSILRGLERRRWYGNVRELRNVLERAVLLDERKLPAPTHRTTLTTPTSTEEPSLRHDLPYVQAKMQVLEHFERTYVERALEESGGNVAQAARSRQMDRAHLFRLIRKHELTGS